MKRELYAGAGNFSLEEVVSAIEQGRVIAGLVEGGSFYIRIDEYRPVVCTAIHNGHNLRDELSKNCLLEPSERFYEEDPYTDEFILSFPIVLIGNDSRFEYDLNRPMNQSTYFKSAWDRQVWKRKLSDKQRETSHQKHKAFYRVVETLVAKLESLFKSCIVFDIHSYNYQRHQKDTPTFNIGSEQIDSQRWSGIVKHYNGLLNQITLPNLDCRSAVNEMFQGKGYLIAHINARFDNTLVLPTEVKKVFMDEHSGEPFPFVLRDLKTAFRSVVTQTSELFIRKHTKHLAGQKAGTSVLSGKIETAVAQVDAKLWQLCRGLDVLSYINPTNFLSEKRRFFERKGNYVPVFKYKQIDVDPFKLKSELYQLPIHNIADTGLQAFYQEVIEDLDSRISLLTGIGSKNFLLNSVRYHGKPEPKLLQAAEFIASAPAETGTKFEAIITVDQALERIKAEIDKHNINCKAEKNRKLVAKMMLDHERSTILLATNATYTQGELNSLINNQLLIQMVASLNAHGQPLKILSIGLPGYNRTLEGLGIYNEFVAGTLSIARLKLLALRVLATQHMLNHDDFASTYRYITEDYHEEPDTAFTLVSRVYRAGGNTKDFHYLAGFADILGLPEDIDKSFLMSGKVGLQSYHQLQEFVARGFIQKPETASVRNHSVKTLQSTTGYLVSVLLDKTVPL